MNMRPFEYEQYVCEYYQQRGYAAFTTQQSGDYGVDVFAEKGNRKIAVQVKKYGGSRKINRATIMELYGAMAYFDCTHAAVVTDGSLLPDAMEVAEKLGIEVIVLSGQNEDAPLKEVPEKEPESAGKSASLNFDSIWEDYILPLKGKILSRPDGKSNQIVDADWGGVTRISSQGKKSHIKIEIFKWAIHVLLEKGSVTRNDINQNYVGRASSGVVLILSQVPFFRLLDHPVRLELKNN